MPKAAALRAIFHFLVIKVDSKPLGVSAADAPQTATVFRLICQLPGSLRGAVRLARSSPAPALTAGVKDMMEEVQVFISSPGAD
ncbi:hypothetical protein EYF80_034390 [Liparis tanakae]|uniref:Uncharacterized protein n=1 Tax=Liparis tanakae TaxID=230148 RepID=A0A4Z2GP05_9TELE|nr:hypothetical protein EYF80_034390 [Liparis tanakae]